MPRAPRRSARRLPTTSSRAAPRGSPPATTDRVMGSAAAPPRPSAGPLAGVGVIVTRPARQAAGLVRTLDAMGARPIVWPAIVILPPADATALARAHAALASYDLAI